MTSIPGFLRFIGINGQAARKSATKAKTRRSVRLGVEAMEERAVPAVLAVTNNFDCGEGSLRQAILDSNANPGVDRIAFLLDESNNVIRPQSALPDLTDTVLIDASSRDSLDGRPTVEIDGSWAGAGASGFVLRSSGNTIRGLSINGFDRSGIEVHSSFNKIESNFLGLTREGFARGNVSTGIHLLGDAQFNTIGTNGDGHFDAIEGNVISGNGRGIGLDGANVHHNRVAGNKVGVNPNGLGIIGNEGAGDGVWVVNGAHHNVIGTNGDGMSDDLEGNEIAGHRWAGVAIYNDGTNDNAVAGNRIHHNTWGVALQYAEVNGPSYNRIGTNADGFSDAQERNMITENGTGVLFAGPGVQGNTVYGNAFGSMNGGQQRVVEIEGAIANPVGREGIDGVRGNTDAFAVSMPPMPGCPGFIGPVVVCPIITPMPVPMPRIDIQPFPVTPPQDFVRPSLGFIGPTVVTSATDDLFAKKAATSPLTLSIQATPQKVSSLNANIISSALRQSREFNLSNRIGQLRR